ncbi:uncharacterized protein LOC124161060 isoform X2 [Ischnura elegans]|uniref:uncharacterized protein LOC124161060 isoform X2 n=1 Tax=Ischnura elegans TaxID=197161 RepID=UPI001ED8BFB5|nr:uncharacterized protein LOC124161060 isoform X2 [Ischnura elegans]
MFGSRLKDDPSHGIIIFLLHLPSELCFCLPCEQSPSAPRPLAGNAQLGPQRGYTSPCPRRKHETPGIQGRSWGRPASGVSRVRRRASSASACSNRMPPPLATLFLVASTVLGIAEACSSRSTPKPRAPSPTARPNITFHTYACPPAYAAWYCLNGATCFTVKIGESLLYNCECADGYMGQRCEFKDLENSYLPSRRRVMLETASIASGATIAVLLVVIVCFAFYIHFKRKHKPHSETNMPCEPGACQVDGVERRRPFSTRPPHSISLVPIPHTSHHPHSSDCYPAPTHSSILPPRLYPVDQGPGVYVSEIGDHRHEPYHGEHLPFPSSIHWGRRWDSPPSSSPLSVPHYSRPYRVADPRHGHRDRPPDPRSDRPLPPPPPHGPGDYLPPRNQ